MSSSLRSLWGLDPDLVFLNHGSFGACPRSVLERQTEWRQQMEADPVHFFVRIFPEALDNARDKLAATLGTTADALAFVPNATTGVNAVLRSLDWNPGEEVVVGTQAYNACRNALEFVASRNHLTVRVAELPFPCKSQDEIVEGYLAACSNKTRLVLLDHITSPTGLVLPMERIVKELSTRNIESLIDGAHAPGQIPLDLDSLQADYYTGNAHKWLCAPKGCAFLWVREDRREAIRPTSISHGANAALKGRSRYHEEFDWTGTVDPSPWLCLPDAIDTLASLHPEGLPGHMNANRDLALAARRLLANALEIALPSPDDMIGALAAMPLPPEEGEAIPSPLDVSPLQQRLYDKHKIQLPILSWPQSPNRVLRVSAQRYNQIGEYALLADALAEEGIGRGAARIKPRS